jgi:hypothetical protein
MTFPLTTSGPCPRIFHVATALEIWDGRQSLGMTDPLGKRDIADPTNVRTFIMAGTQHVPAPLLLPAAEPFGVCQQQPNPNPQVWTMRALLTALVDWVRDNKAPPASAVPSIGDGTLVPPAEDDFCSLTGSFIPFAQTKQERLAGGDPRLSIEERYPNNQSYVAAVRRAAEQLVAARLLLPRDASRLVAEAESEGLRLAP